MSWSGCAGGDGNGKWGRSSEWGCRFIAQALLYQEKSSPWRGYLSKTWRKCHPKGDDLEKQVKVVRGTGVNPLGPGGPCEDQARLLCLERTWEVLLSTPRARAPGPWGPCKDLGPVWDEEPVDRRRQEVSCAAMHYCHILLYFKRGD